MGAARVARVAAAAADARPQALEEYGKAPEFAMYLAFIFGHMEDVEMDSAVRQIAGLHLKNNVKQHFSSWSDDVRSAVRDTALKMLGSAESKLRGTASSIVTAAVRTDRLEAWPGLLPQLVERMEDGDEDVVDGALNTLQQLCEEAPGERARPRRSSGGRRLTPSPPAQRSWTPRTWAARSTPSSLAGSRCWSTATSASAATRSPVCPPTWRSCPGRWQPT